MTVTPIQPPRHRGGTEGEPRVCAALLSARAGRAYCADGHPGTGCGPDCAGYRGRVVDSNKELWPLDLDAAQLVRVAAWERAKRAAGRRARAVAHG